MVALSQLSRAPEAAIRQGLMSDLRESGSYRAGRRRRRLYLSRRLLQATDENKGMAELIIAKQRNGPTGTVKLAFLKEFTRFENYYGS